MDRSKWTDQELVSAIQRGDKDRTSALKQIFQRKQVRQEVIQYIKSRQGNLQDGQDIFHEGLIVLDGSIRDGKFRAETSINGYLFSICRMLWWNQLRKKQKTLLTAENPKNREPDFQTPEIQLINEELQEVLRQLLEQLSPKCQHILELWQLHFSMEEIAEQLQLENATIARKTKYRCMQSLIDRVKGQPDLVKYLRG